MSLSILVILGLIGGAYILGTKTTNNIKLLYAIPSPTQHPSPTVSTEAPMWQTYSNTQLGISFSYPKGYVTLQEQPDQVRLMKGLSYIFEVKRIPTKDTVNTWWQKNGTTDWIKSTQPWNNYQAYSFKINSTNVQVPMDFYAIRVDNATYTSSAIYTISYETDFPGSDSIYQQINANFDKTEKPILKKIVDSFRFQDPHFSMSDY